MPNPKLELGPAPELQVLHKLKSQIVRHFPLLGLKVLS